MARRRTKKRTHVGARNGPSNGAPSATPVSSRAPKSMVIRIGAGEVGPSVSQLVKDVRAMMEPETASRLKVSLAVRNQSAEAETVCEQERNSNRLRDYTTMAGPLGVSHLLLFSRSTTGNTNMRMALTPRGPTLHFRVEKYSLSKDVQKAIKHPKSGGKEYLSAPLLVMNNFISPPPIDGSVPIIPKHLESLTTTIFQSLFPPISPQSTPIYSIRRVLLVNRELPKSSSTTSSIDDGSYVINLRHYAITTKRTGLSRGIRRLNAAEKILKDRKGRRVLPNLGKLEDVADYLLDPLAEGGGFTSGSESEIETDAEVEVLETDIRKTTNRNQRGTMQSGDGNKLRREGAEVEKRAVKLVELGPRLKLRMTKVEEGVCGGKVMWHEFLCKSKKETEEMDKIWEQRRREREERRRVQKENIERKRNDRGEEVNQAEEEDDDMLEGEWDSEELEGDVEMDTNENKGPEVDDG